MPSYTHSLVAVYTYWFRTHCHHHHSSLPVSCLVSLSLHRLVVFSTTPLLRFHRLYTTACHGWRITAHKQTLRLPLSCRRTFSNLVAVRFCGSCVLLDSSPPSPPLTYLPVNILPPRSACVTCTHRNACFLPPALWVWTHVTHIFTFLSTLIRSTCPHSLSRTPLLHVLP